MLKKLQQNTKTPSILHNQGFLLEIVSYALEG